MKRLFGWCGLLAVLTWPLAAAGQGLTPRPGGAPPQHEKDKPAGPAEAAPEGEGVEPELPPLPQWPGQEERKLQFFSLSGYFRLRGDLFHNMNLSQETQQNAAAPFFEPISELPGSPLSCAQRVGKAVPGGGDRDLDADDCPANTLAGANMRLRVQPTINVAEKVRVHAQLDIFDNLLLGSTPNGAFGGPAALGGTAGRAAFVPLIAFSDTQVPPIVGRNSFTPSIVVKRAWAEVDTPLGQLKFGRMPSHWGLGLLANDGNCLDCDYGDNADRIMFTTKLANHVFGMAYDFAASGPTSLTVQNGMPLYQGQVIDLEQLDDVDQLIWVIGRIDRPEVIKDRIELGELVLNYGLYLVYRQQSFDYVGGSVGLGSTERDFARNMVERHAWAWIPDLWFKLMYKKLYIEAESAIIAGEIGNTGGQNEEQTLDILSFGWVVRSQYKLLRDALKVGLEVGMASGDQSEAGAELNRRRALVLQDPTFNDNDLREFRFDFDYHVDLILFRELLGTVANAVYFKPSVQYDLLDSFGARLDIIYSVAHRPVAYPGNDPNLGLEFDLDVYYRNLEEGFAAGLSYGVLIPFAGLDRPADIFGGSDSMFGGGSGRADSASVAQTLQARLLVVF